MKLEFLISSVAFLSGFGKSQGQNQCISLQTSTQCYEYKNYSIISFPGVSNAAEFDAYIQSQSAFNFQNCPGWSNVKGTPIRYSRTFVCGWAIYFSSTLAPASTRCNTAAPTAPMPICQASAQAALADVQAQLTKSCSSVQMYPQYTSFAQSIGNSNCLLGVGQDLPLKCGFQNTNEATTFCQQNANALCCTAPTNVVGGPSTNSSATVTSSSAAAASPTSSAPPSINPNQNGTSTDTASSTATPSTPAASSSSSSGISVSPLLIGAAALGLALVAVLASVLYFMTKKKGDSVEDGHNNNRKSMMAAAVAPAAFDDKSAAGGDTMECIFEYKANLFDELGLEVGDEVEVINKFDDGWALGRNMTSGKEGTFPLACLAPFGAGSEYRDSRFESQYSKRDSSIRYTVDSSTFSRPY